MPRAVELIVAAVRSGAPILVHGDYDVDGQCAAALLTRVLSSVGGRAHAFVPQPVARTDTISDRRGSRSAPP